MPDAPRLTAQEVDTIRLSAEGLSDQDIARALYLSVNGIKSRLKTLFQKTGVHNRAHLIHWAYQRGYLTVEASTVDGGAP